MPMTAAQRRAQASRLAERLRVDSMEAVVSQELQAFSQWFTVMNGPIRRMQRNLNMVYSPEELRSLLYSTIKISIENDEPIVE
jgi:hypothetical protein